MSDEEGKTAPGFTMSDPEPAKEELPRLDFSTFVLSLGTSGMVHLGKVPLEEGGEPPPPNLPLAQQTIDTLDMLQEKTKGNLSDEESKLIQSVLYELRMSFVKAKAGSNGGEASRG